MSLGRTRVVLERQALVARLEESGGDVAAVAARAGLSVERLRAKMAEHGLAAPRRPRATPPVRRAARDRRFRRVAPRTWVPTST